jgi:hypothetical protein
VVVPVRGLKTRVSQIAAGEGAGALNDGLPSLQVWSRASGQVAATIIGGPRAAIQASGGRQRADGVR